MRPYLEKTFTKIGLVGWLKVKALQLKLPEGNLEVTQRQIQCFWPVIVGRGLHNSLLNKAFK
jgi:hypothetical protein